MKGLLTIIVVMMALSFADNALASKKIENRLQAVAISLTEAIAIAEGATQGVAYEAELEKNSFDPEYEVEVYVDGSTYEVSINAVTSEIIRIREDGKKD